MEAMKTAETREDNWSFASVFVCDPNAPSFGFTSWDDFFTRRYRPGARPVAYPYDDKIITHPCEAQPFRIYYNANNLDRFWVKGYPYSLYHMLAHDPLAGHFVGGTIYQAFLTVMNYHRWHSPVSGTIVKTYLKQGTYYAAAPNLDEDAIAESHASAPTSMASCNDPSDHELIDASQSYITAIATRAIIFIQADNPLIGLMCVLPVGMAEIGTCDITVSPGQHVQKGDELGMFHFGGSTVCMIFRKEVDLVFDLHGEKANGLGSKNVNVNARIATVVEKKKEER